MSVQKVSEITSIILSKKTFCCVLSSYIAIKSVNYVYSQKLIFFDKVYQMLKKFLKRKEEDDEIEYMTKNNLLLDYVFFDASNVDCRRHVIKREPCTLQHCSYYKLKYIIDFLESAVQSIDLCMYLITTTDLSNILIKAHDRGIKVRVIVEEEMSTSSESKAQALIHAGIKVKSKVLPSFMHHKFCIVDADVPYKRKVLTGSLNWTLQGIAGNWENIIVVRHKHIVVQYHEEFQNIWDYFDFKTKKIITPKQRYNRKYQANST